MKLRTGSGAGRRTPRRYFVLLLAGVLILGPLASCKTTEAEQTCTGAVEEYHGRCLPHVTAKYLGCIEGRGFSVTDEIGGGVTLPAIARSTVNVAYTHSKEEDTTVALQIVHDCLALAENNATSGDDRGVAHEYVQQTTRYIGIVKRKLPGIELDPSATLDCGSADIGGPAVPCPTSVTIKSIGIAALDIGQVQVTGADSNDFKAGDECVNKTLNPDESCTMTVQFQPTATGKRTAVLVIHQNIPLPDHGTPLQLVGTGAGTQTAGAHTLTVMVDDSAAAGGVTSMPAGVDCPDTCSVTFDDGTDVTLSAVYDQGGGNVTWGECDTLVGDNCIVHLTANRTISAKLSA
jgi:hypothetical protein